MAEIANLILAVTTLVTLFVTVWQFIYFKKIELKKDLKKQAIKVASWTDGSMDKDGELPLILVNTSDLPIYNVFVFLVFSKESESFDELEGCILHFEFIDVLPPGSNKIKVSGRGNSSGGGHDLPAILFTDSDGNGWYRGKFGSLLNINDYILKINDFGISAPFPNSRIERVKHE
ncbi:hypothetical protein BFC22_06875 [Carnobacterium divergens]|uniref:hypothetical protein n=1 Tax=Carnobacterium divergens TaxID=2748 RepID=UPI000E76D4B8|nr:hypothetical protein [Carnobacterium divergens]ANZ99837.1 hypothetical protein BFC22_06875 [Carnobacterium divergens]